MYLDRIRRGSVSAEEKAVVVSDRDAAVVLDARNALGQLTADQATAWRSSARGATAWGS